MVRPHPPGRREQEDRRDQEIQPDDLPHEEVLRADPERRRGDEREGGRASWHARSVRGAERNVIARARRRRGRTLLARAKSSHA